MRIDGFTCCVGPVYAAYLRASLPTWLDTLDSLTVVTDIHDDHTIATCQTQPEIAGEKFRLVKSSLLRAHGADFNKGALLCQAYAAMDPLDWVLHFDSDILPPQDWRQKVEGRLRKGFIHGCKRTDEQGKLIVDKPPLPYGFFQLWHAEDPACQKWPIFEPWHRSCGSYDTWFNLQWPLRLKAEFDFRVMHFGEVRANWFGVGLEATKQAESYRKMLAVHMTGLHETRIIESQPANRLKVPLFAAKLCFPNPKTQRTSLRIAATDDPFLIDARVGSHAGYEPMTDHREVEKRVCELYRQRHGRDYRCYRESCQ